MSKEYDLIVIGLGPAGMAVSIMGAEMGLKVCAIEKHKVGGECMNVGCIPSKALLRMAKYRSAFDKLGKMELAATAKPEVMKPFARIQGHLDFISEKKTMGMFKKVDMVYQEGGAVFVDPHTVEVAGKKYTAKKIFICVGTRPAVPEFEGLEGIDYLTNENVFAQEKVPESLIITGGGAIACEMAQAFSRLGSKVTVIIRRPRLMWREDREATDIIEETFEREGIEILREQKPVRFENKAGRVVMHTDKGEKVEAEKVLVAAGRKLDFSELKLEKAGIRTDSSGAIGVNKYLQTNLRHIFAVGDCNGYAQLSHAAMHQGMIAIMNSMMPGPMKRDFRKYAVPWTMFTEPAFSHVGMRESELKKKGIKYEVIRSNYGDYGAAIAEAVDVGFVKALVSPTGRIYGVDIIGEGSGEMINEWALAVQKKLRIHDIMMLQHSFPTMGFLSKRVAETWMMNKMKSEKLKNVCRFMFRI
ncbi:MAG: NAD(P)/FAD-dependent oxidoreductase [Planctomycetes bacterium]|nr:NAD(P)/FAD-dependent oxidoreductase [Planctomycetota bacterium]